MELKKAHSLRLLVLSFIAIVVLIFLSINTLLLIDSNQSGSYDAKQHGSTEENDDEPTIWVDKDPDVMIERDRGSSGGDESSMIALDNKLTFDDIMRNIRFDIRGNDVIVFLHIQKTGGTTFGKHLVQDLDIENPCVCNEDRKKCKCVRPDAKSEEELWLISRHSTGWKCGLHADWTELNDCLNRELTYFQSDNEQQQIYQSKIFQPIKSMPSRRYLYISFLREPVQRFVSEFKHVQRGATWKGSRHLCSGRPPTYDELPPCYNGTNWKDVSIEHFLSCKSNLAFNRQTRMLANLTLVDCYNSSSMDSHLRDEIMLNSAKENLEKMAFFGLCEHQEASQLLFEVTFRMKFKKPFVQSNVTRTSQVIGNFSTEILNVIEKLNYLDLQLYNYAAKLFFKRIKALTGPDTDIQMNAQPGR